MRTGRRLWMAVAALIVYITLLMCVLFCNGCTTARQTSNTTTTVKQIAKDSSTVVTATVLSNADSIVRIQQITDTAIGIPGAIATLSIDEHIDTVVRSGALTLRTYTDRQGKRRIDCKSDSLTLVIRNLVRERDFFRHSADALLAAEREHIRSTAVDSTSVNTTVTTGRLSLMSRIHNILFIAGICLAAAAVGYMIRTFKKN